MTNHPDGPQCACPLSDPFDCIAVRYGRERPDSDGRRDDGYNERCECVCHEPNEDDDEF
jgi:hypothetical protein